MAPATSVHITADCSCATSTPAAVVTRANSRTVRVRATRAAWRPRSISGEPPYELSPVRVKACSSRRAVAVTVRTCSSSKRVGESTLRTPTMRRFTVNGTASSATTPGTVAR